MTTALHRGHRDCTGKDRSSPSPQRPPTSRGSSAGHVKTSAMGFDMRGTLSQTLTRKI